MNDENSKLDNQQLLYSVAQELSSLIIREHQILRSELNQVGVLVEDASQTLGDNFRLLKEYVADNKEEKVDDANEIEDSGDVKAFSKQVETCATNMMRALQFDDIVQQLASHADDRIGQMQELFEVMDNKLSELKTSKIENEQTTQVYLQLMLANVTKYRELLEKSNPVKQETMGAGNIELF